MAPERFSTGETKPASDVYALACVLYQCLTGHPPYPGDTLEQIAVGHMVTPPPQPSEERQTIPTTLDHVITTGLAKQPTDRYPTTIAMATAARQALTTPTDLLDATQPTQPAARIASNTPPTAPPYFGGPPAPPVGKRRRPIVLIGVLMAVVMLVAAGVFAVVKFTQHDNRAAGTPSSTAAVGPPPNTGPFTGIYQADFGRATTLDGAGNPSSTLMTGTYGVRSVCRPVGCVATASKFNGDASFASTLVFDQVGASWVAVALVPSPCKDATSQTWQAFTLQPRPDGSLAGELVRLTAEQCQEKRTVNFTRTGDVDFNADFKGVADPAVLPPRVVSPAEALHGRYSITRTFAGRSPQALGESSVTTYCLRSGDRCMSYFSVPSGDLPLVFGIGNWDWKNESDGPCPNGENSHLNANAQFPLPQPPQNPIPALTGHGTWVQTGACAVNYGFDETFTRTGD